MADCKVVIVGAGLVGSLAAVYCCERGVKCVLYDKRADPRLCKTSRNRSINLALSHRGLSALKAIGLDRVVLEKAIPMKGRLLHTSTGEKEDLYGDFDEAIYSIDRNWLNQVLVSEVERRGAKVHFEHTFEYLSLEDSDECPSVHLVFTTNDNVVRRKAARVLGCDGVHSRIRSELERIGEPICSHEKVSELQYKEIEIPAGSGLSLGHLHIWPRLKEMLIALPNSDGSFTATLFSTQFPTIDVSPETYFEEHYGLDKYMSPDQLHIQYKNNPVSGLSSIQCSQYHNSQGTVVLLGDAGHAILPFYGQGMNAGFEDVSILFDLVADNAFNFDRVFGEFTKTRKKDADAIMQLAEANYREMNGGSLTLWYRLKRRVNSLLHRVFPAHFIPLYTMISFTSIPYSQAQLLDRIFSRGLLASGVLVVMLLAMLGVGRRRIY